jgi:polar amino acid transport system substrate-binding protein
MMRTRHLSAVATLAVLLLMGAACSSSKTTTGGGGTPSASATASPLPSFSTLKSGVLQAASCLEFPPFEAVKATGPEGFDIDIVNEIAKRLGLTVQWVKTDFDSSFTALAGGQFDMIAAAVTATGQKGMERSQIIDFTDFYFNARQSLAVNTTKTPSLTSIDQLKAGDVIGAQKGTTGLDWAKENLEPKGIKIKTYQTSPDSFRDLEAGNITGVVNDGPASDAIVKDLADVKVVQYIDTNEKYALAISKDNPGLKAAVNIEMQAMFKDGTYKTIFEKWFPGAVVPPEFSGG